MRFSLFAECVERQATAVGVFGLAMRVLRVLCPLFTEVISKTSSGLTVGNTTRRRIEVNKSFQAFAVRDAVIGEHVRGELPELRSRMLT